MVHQASVISIMRNPKLYTKLCVSKVVQLAALLEYLDHLYAHLILYLLVKYIYIVF